MASGDTLTRFTAAHGMPAASSPAALFVRNNQLAWAFDDATDESIEFSDVLPRHYAGGGFTVILHWMAASATSGNVKWNVQVERNDDEGTDLDSDSFATAQTATQACPATNGAAQYTAISLSSSQIDSLAVGEGFRLRVTRDANDAGDTMVGDAQLLRVEIQEP